MSKHVAVQNLTHHEVARRLQLGQEPQEIAEAMCMRVELVEALIRRPAFKALLAELTDKQYEGLDESIKEKTRDIQAEIDEQCGESMDRLTALLKSAASESVQMHIAQDFLDRGGYSKGAQEPTTVIQGQPFTFTSGVECLNDTCGDVTATLDPESPLKI